MSISTMSTAPNQRSSSPQTAELPSPVVAATLTSNLSLHALWSIDISRQGLSQLSATLPDGSPAPSPFPPVMGYLNMSNNHLGITAIVTGLAGVNAIFHLNIIGNPAMRGFGIHHSIALLPQHRDHMSNKPVATSSGGPPLSQTEARDVLVASLPFVWCLNFAFIDPETDNRASSTVGKYHLSHLLPREPRFTGQMLCGLQGDDTPQVVNPWGKRLVDSIPKALEYDWRSCFWQLRTLAKDIDGELLEDEMNAAKADSLGLWAEFPVDNPAAGLMLCTSLMLMLDPSVSKELARACLPNVWAMLAKSSPGRKLPSWSVLLASSSVQVFKVIAVLLGVMANDAAKASSDEQSLRSSLERQVQALVEEQFDGMRKFSKVTRFKSRNRRVVFEILSLIVSTVPEGDFSQHGPWLHDQVALLRQDMISTQGQLAMGGHRESPLSRSSGANSVVQQRYSLLLNLENLMTS